MKTSQRGLDLIKQFEGFRDGILMCTPLGKKAAGPATPSWNTEPIASDTEHQSAQPILGAILFLRSTCTRRSLFDCVPVLFALPNDSFPGCTDHHCLSDLASFLVAEAPCRPGSFQTSTSVRKPRFRAHRNPGMRLTLGYGTSGAFRPKQHSRGCQSSRASGATGCPWNSSRTTSALCGRQRSQTAQFRYRSRMRTAIELAHGQACSEHGGWQ